MAARLFLCYSHSDSAFVQRLRTSLEAKDIDVRGDWLLERGEDYKVQLQRLILESDAFAFSISPNSVASEECLIELGTARELNKRLLPLIAVETSLESVPPSLREIQWTYFTDQHPFIAPH